MRAAQATDRAHTAIAMAEGGEQPILRWPSVLHPLPATFLGFPTPLPPTSSRPQPDGDARTGLADPAALQEVVAALQGVDVSYL